MKKKLFLLPIALLLLGGCSGEETNPGGSTSGSTSGIIPPSTTVEQALTILQGLNEYKVAYKLDMVNDSSFPFVPGVRCELTQSINGLARIKGTNSGQNTDDGGMKMHYVLKISDVAAATGWTVEQMQQMVEANQQYIEEYTFDIPNDRFEMVMDGQEDYMTPHEWVYTIKNPGDKQTKYGEFFNGKLMHSEYMMDGDGISDLQSFYTVSDILVSKKDQLVEQDQKYALDLSSGPIDLGHGQTVSKLIFSYSSNDFTIDYESQIASEHFEASCVGQYRIYDVNHAEVTILQFEVFCPYEHKTVRHMRLNDQKHILICDVCGKILQDQPEDHAHDGHGLCHICDSYQMAPSGSTHFTQKLKDGSTYLQGYISPLDEIFYISCNSGMTSFDAYTWFADKEEAGHIDFFGGEDNILIVSYSLGNEAVGGCMNLYKQQYSIFEGIDLALTPAQEEIIASGDPAQIENVYRAVFGLNEVDVRYSNFVSKFGSPKSSFIEYTNMTYHKHTTEHNVHPDGTCFYGSYEICDDCGEKTQHYGSYQHHHSFEVIDNPSWARDGYYYVEFGECSVCHDEGGFIGELYKYNTHEIYQNTWAIDDTGVRHGHNMFYNFMPHIDHNEDMKCDICNSVRLSVTHEGVTYSIYVYNNEVVNSGEYWTPMGSIDPVDGFELYNYRYTPNDLIHCTVGWKFNEDHSEIQYRFGIGDDWYNSPSYPVAKKG